MSKVDKSKSPYYDDHKESKQYHEVLFKPSVSVQTRELNELQTMFNEQISRFGDHMFVEGSVVIPGETNYDLNYKYVTVTIPNYSDIVTLLNSDLITLQGVNGITANVKQFVPADDTDPATFYLEYLNASTDKTKNKFESGNLINILYDDTLIGQATTVNAGLGSKFTINDGVYYIGSRFVIVNKQTVLLSKYSSSPSNVICLLYEESIVTSNDDTSLHDNAQGEPNYKAPGADRLKVDTTLTSYPISELDSLPQNAVEIFRILNGEVQLHYRGVQYNILNDVLSQRTYEQSGDYTVKSFKIGFSEYENVYDDVDETKFVTQLDPGIAYVRGYRVESSGRTDIKTNKARSTGIINNSSISSAMGYYISVSNPSALPSVSTLQTLEFQDVAVSVAGDNPAGTVLGTARVRFVVRDGDDDWRLYLFDVKNAAGEKSTAFIQSALSIYSSDTVTFTADINDAVILEASNNSLIFPMNVKFVKTLADGDGDYDTAYSSVKQLTGVTDSNGDVTFTASPNEVFVNQDSRYAFSYFTDDDTYEQISDKVTLSGSPTGSSITIAYGIGEAARPVRVNLQVAKEGVVQKTKTTQTTSKAGALTSGVLSLGKADAYELVSVLDNDSNDVTSLFTLTTNKSPSFYGISSIKTTSSVAEPVTATFKYLAHSSGDYFGADSYVDFEYEDIPVEDGYRLSDVLDFRPRIADSGLNFTGTGSSVGNIPTPFTIIRTDIEHYLPRKDKVYLKSDGQFGVAEGVPSLSPKLPDDPAGAMVLYTMDVPAYTFSLNDIQAKKISNRRYTMKDIGALENRLSNVEYYVSLNMLELETEAKQISDPLTGLTRFKNGFIADPFVDHSVGDFNWEGYRVSVSPEDGVLRPEFSNKAIDLELNMGSSSNIVENSGIVTLPFTEVSFVNQPLRTTTINVNPYAIYSWTGNLKLTPEVDSWVDTEYLDPNVTYRVFNNGELEQTWNSWQLNWTGGTIIHEVLSRETEEADLGTLSITTANATTVNVDVVNNRLIDTSVIPFMRKLDVGLLGKGNRPNTKMNFFFNNTKINEFIKPKVGGAFGDPIIADAQGGFDAVFRIPNDETNSFRTGEYLVVATDEEDNLREQSTSYAEATFGSTGIRNTRQRTIVATRSTGITKIRRVIWNDPLAQSFLVERNGGVFVTKINTFFSTKDSKVPVSIEIREMENGMPTQRTIPGAIKMLNPSEVNISTDGSIATTFEFDYPIYLVDGVEYCFVLMSNSNAYNAYIATLSEIDLGTGKTVAEQPYTGVMFKSQNNSTWTEDQNSDLQFEIFTAKFDTNVVGTVLLENKDFDLVRLLQNPFITTDSSNEVIVYRKRHNYAVGSSVVIAGAVGGNNIPTGEFNTTHTVTEVLSPNEFVITVSTNANANGSIGGSNVTITETIQASILNPNIPVSEFPQTSVTLEVKGTTGKSISGTEVPYSSINTYKQVSNNEINKLVAPWLITNSIDEGLNLGGDKSFTMRATISSDNENISPVIDTIGCTVITPFVLVTYPESYSPDGENNWANYRTKISSLKNAADALKMYLDINKPQGSEIKVSARFGNSTEEVEAAEWVEVPNIVGGSLYGTDNYVENEFEKTGIESFTAYQVMIQLQSQSATKYPVCKRERIIVLADFSEV